jgi:murein tripeptide amidase MpaA
MARRLLVAALCLLLVLPATVATAQSEQQVDDDAAELDVYTAEVEPGDDVQLRKDGVDVIDVAPVEQADKDKDKETPTITVEMVLSPEEAAALEDKGVEVELKTNAEGQSVAEAATLRAEAGFDVWRPWSGAGGLQEEMEQLAEEYPHLTKLVTIGESLQGKPIYALKVTTKPRRRDGRKPSVLYASTQHAREWITPEVNRRLLHHYLENYGRDPQITDLVANNELWFILVLNPDGYDHTFTEGNRLWRKNLRDNNGDGQITGVDGVDLNRNFPTKWGYDNEGSSPEFANQTYRGTAPASEPETRALDTFMSRIGFEFMVNYHSAAELLLYGVGWQVATPTPDDRIYEAMAGTDENPAVPGYDPDISAELYTTNGETTEHVHAKFDTLAFTPELDTCKSATLFFDDDEWEPSDCDELGFSVFEFPDDEELVQFSFEKNLPFALAVAASAADPDDPVSPVGLDNAPFYVDSFTVSHGPPQTVAVEAKRALKNKRLYYRINGGRARSANVKEWKGGERYGDEGNTYYAEYRGTVRRARAGDEVEVWFEGREAVRGGRNRTVASDHFTYEVASDSGADVLVIANEDYTGVNPQQEGGPNALPYYTAALDDNGVAYDTWDTDVDGVPHDLGVLSHYDTVIWETGADRINQDPEDETIFVDDSALGPNSAGEYPDIGVAERQQYLMLAVRDFLNDGGKLFHAGENAGYFGIFGFVGGLYYGLNGAPDQECVVEESIDQNPADAIFGDCLIYADDFYQYYLGAYARTPLGGPGGFEGTGDLAGVSGLFGGPGLEANPLDEAGNFTVTSEVLPPDQFPQFASAQAATYGGDTGPGPYEPFEGENYVGALHADNSFMRLQRTVNVPDGGGALTFALSYDTEIAYDHVIVEATAADGTRTTLPEAGGLTATTASAACSQYPALHPSLLVYDGIGPCQSADTTGTWNSFNGSSGGWQNVEFDLSAYSGQEVTVSISYVTDAGAGGVGVFVDNVQVPGEEVEGFEDGLGAWTIPGSPADSPPNTTDWVQGGTLFIPSAGVETDDTVLFGFGLEHIEDPAVRAATLERVLDHLN